MNIGKCCPCSDRDPETGDLCPYADPPRTVEGQATAEVFQACAGQVEVSMLGAGVPPASILAMAKAIGCDMRAVAFLLPFGQAGLARAIMEARQDG